MIEHYINTSFTISNDDIEFYQKSGFIKLKNFFSPPTINFFIEKVKQQLSSSDDIYAKGFFNKSSYDILKDEKALYGLFNDPKFVSLMNRLNQRSLFFTQGIGFELKKNIDKGFPWHTGSTSFGYMQPDDFGCTLWTPLSCISNAGQKGGMGYVPTDILSGRFMYDYIDHITTEYIRDKVNSTGSVSNDEVLEMSVDILNSPAMKKLLDYSMVADNFNLGDALIFNKYVIHRSIMLEEGELDSRMAFVMRFVDVNASYNKVGADDIEYPSKQFGYKASSTFHKDVYDKSTSIISESSYFENNAERVVK